MAKATRAAVAVDDHQAEEEISPVALVRKSAIRQAAPQDIQPEGAKWGRWSIVAQAEHTIEDALHPRYLYAKADQMGKLDYVEIKHPHGFWTVCLDVVKVDRIQQGIVAHIRHVFDYREAKTMVKPDLSGARVEFLGDRQWSVVDGHHVAQDGFPTMAAAEAWLSDARRG